MRNKHPYIIALLFRLFRRFMMLDDMIQLHLIILIPSIAVTIYVIWLMLGEIL